MPPPSLDPPSVAVFGRRTVLFEAAGPDPSDVLTWLHSAPPLTIGEQPVVFVGDPLDAPHSTPADSTALYLDTGKITVSVDGSARALALDAEFPPSSTSDPATGRRAARRDLMLAVNALAAWLSDPERLRTEQSLADANNDPSEEAAALFASTPRSFTREQALRLIVNSIDLTTLAGDDTNGRVRALCGQALRPDPTDPTVGPVATVCVYPNFVSLASELTQSSTVAVASVASAFPSGHSSLEVRLSDISEAVVAGADEIDIVLNRAAFLSGNHDLVSSELKQMRQQIGTRVMKTILETSELGSTAAIRAGALIALRAGTDWIKTSTGKSGQGATPLAVMTMAQAIADETAVGRAPAGIKVSGGVRTSAEALGYLAIVEDVLGPEWLDPSRVRFGASSLLDAVVSDLAAL